jgi:preprotein translocase subunit Sss1
MTQVIEKLDTINKTLESILEVLKKPESKFEKVLEYGGAGVGILGILSIIDIIRTWLVGG